LSRQVLRTQDCVQEPEGEVLSAFGSGESPPELPRDLLVLAVEARPVGGFRLRLEVPHGERSLDGERLEPVQGESETELRVEDEVEVLAQQSELVEHVATPERRRLRDVPRASQPAGP